VLTSRSLVLAHYKGAAQHQHQGRTRAAWYVTRGAMAPHVLAMAGGVYESEGLLCYAGLSWLCYAGLSWLCYAGLSLRGGAYESEGVVGNELGLGERVARDRVPLPVLRGIKRT
jgi:hypothetical protein